MKKSTFWNCNVDPATRKINKSTSPGPFQLNIYALGQPSKSPLQPHSQPPQLKMSITPTVSEQLSQVNIAPMTFEQPDDFSLSNSQHILEDALNKRLSEELESSNMEVLPATQGAPFCAATLFYYRENPFCNPARQATLTSTSSLSMNGN